MRRVLVIGLVLPLIGLGAASGPTGVTAVAVSRDGFTPTTAAVHAGDTVAWTNLDRPGFTHQVVFADGSGSPVLQSGQSWSRTFRSKGSFAYHDGRHVTFKATVVVSPALPSVSLSSSLPSVAFGGRTALTGRVSSGKAGAKVQVLARPCGRFALARLASVKTTAGGAFRLRVKPRRTTAYGVRWGKVSSAAVQVPVRPLLRLRAAGGAYSLRLYAAVSFAGKRALLQRFDEAEGTWNLAGQIKLTPGGSPARGTILSVGSGSASGSGRIRAMLPAPAAGACYAPATSNELAG